MVNPHRRRHCGEYENQAEKKHAALTFTEHKQHNKHMKREVTLAAG
jgi:hypothetical protein